MKDKEKQRRWLLRSVQGLMLLLVFGLGLGYSIYSRPETIQAVELPTLGGDRVQIPDAGLTWVNIWSVSCPPCMEEMPYLDRLSEEYAGRARILGVSVNYDPPNVIDDIRARLKLSLPLALDMDGRLIPQLAPKGLVVPSHFLLDAKGEVLASWKGPVSEETIRHAIDQRL
ncbi:MAG TPA: TlpA disulfide reductase family protein [Thiolinea sp.]|nr:TlpA disulfide reductase family protein [Thiolinea sp.]